MRKLLIIPVTMLAAAGAAALLVSQSPSPPAVGKHLSADSRIVTDGTDEMINIRREPHEGNLGPTRQPTELLRVPSDTAARVWCEADDAAPAVTAMKWYFLTLIDGAYPGVSGYVYRNLVRDAGNPPPCTNDIVNAHPRTPGVLSMQQGRPRGAGYYYAVTIRGFHPNWKYSVECVDDSVDLGEGNVYLEEAFRTFEMVTDGEGNGFKADGCYSGEGSRHWVRSGPYTSDMITWQARTPPESAVTTSGAPAPGPVAGSPRIALSQGSAARRGSWYVITLTGFAAGKSISVSCRDSVDPTGFTTFTVRTDRDGAATSSDGCFSGDGPDHWAWAEGMESNHVTWTGSSPAAPAPEAEPTASPPAGPAAPPVPPSPTVSLEQGPAAPHGFRYAVSLQHFAPGTDVTVTCHDSVDPGGFYTFRLRTDGDGNAYTRTQCYSGDHPDHWAIAGGIESNHVSW
ncbi:hypothetical protein [Micromonospora robiginosa]|uniref:Ig-like domain-containing protein n=1 Tax=Micromonospora robiginosa TaxID=2749844 RepID=A0A7L6B625_9ACTN|nr:hypothetical protein [Micromonospora ferruginea]QLQ37339.1 hypothetical protein H1D33_29710 [Micromonospora ferruginea]